MEKFNISYLKDAYSIKQLPPLIIGDLEFKIPVIQGGMGVKISTASLASAVSNCGAAGTISGVLLGYGTPENETNFTEASKNGLIKEIRLAKKLTKAPIGCNILVAVNNFQELAETASNEKIDFLVCGAGLPMHLPEYVNKDTKLIPIVSSGKAIELIIKKWKRKYDKLPDAVIVEGPLAGGHLGFNYDDLVGNKTKSLMETTIEVISIIKEVENLYNVKIPVIPAGGIYDGKDISRFLKVGAGGVQIATRFVVTNECEAHSNFKNLYLSATKTDVEYILSPVGLPGRVIKTKLSQQMNAGEKTSFKCNYHCLKTCKPGSAQICLAQAMYNAFAGKIDEAIVFAGSNVEKISKITSVKELINDLVSETLAELNIVHQCSCIS